MKETNDKILELRQQLEVLYLQMRTGKDCMEEVLEKSRELDNLISEESNETN